MFATLILPLAALIIKVIDRYVHHYTLISVNDKSLPALEPSKAVPSQSNERELAQTKRKQTRIEAEQKKADAEKKERELKAEAKAIERAKREEDVRKERELEAEARAIERANREEAERREKELEAEAWAIALAERQKKQIQLNRTCHRVAELFFPAMTALFYQPDGQLKNVLGRQQFYRDRGGIDPAWYREDADEIEKDDPEKAARLRKEANDIESRISNIGLQTTFFPVTWADKSVCTSDELLQECKEDFTNREFFHGTTKEQASQIQKNGFDPFWKGGANVRLDTGFGTYLATNQTNAAYYAGKNNSGTGTVLKVTVQPKGKIAAYNKKICYIVEDHFHQLADYFARLREDKILEQLAQDDGEDYAKRDAVKYSLLNLFTQDFYTRLGFRGVYATNSPRGTCTYLNLFYPKEDITSIVAV